MKQFEVTATSITGAATFVIEALSTRDAWVQATRLCKASGARVSGVRPLGYSVRQS